MVEDAYEVVMPVCIVRVYIHAYVRGLSYACIHQPNPMAPPRHMIFENFFVFTLSIFPQIVLACKNIWIDWATLVNNCVRDGCWYYSDALSSLFQGLGIRKHNHKQNNSYRCAHKCVILHLHLSSLDFTRCKSQEFEYMYVGCGCIYGMIARRRSQKICLKSFLEVLAMGFVRMLQSSHNGR